MPAQTGMGRGMGVAPSQTIPFAVSEGDSKGLLGGAEGIRTPDLLNAIETRSQLRHSPTKPIYTFPNRLGGAEGIRTPDLISAIDALSQLSYSP